MNDITRILSAMQSGEAADQLLPLVYHELRKLAAAKLSGEKDGESLQPTMLVHEAYLRLVDVAEPQKWSGRGHFFAAAAEAMRRILVERARSKQSLKRGGDWRRVDLELSLVESQTRDDDLLALDEALARLELAWPERALLVKLRYFAGLTIPEVAQVLKLSVATAERHWAFARAWLFSQLHADDRG